MCLKPVMIISLPTHFCAHCRVWTLSRVPVFQAVSYFSSVEHKGKLDLKAPNRENPRPPVSRGLEQGVTHAHCVGKGISAPHTLWSQFPADAITFCFLSPVRLSPPSLYPADLSPFPTKPTQHRSETPLGGKSFRCMQR